MGNQTFALCPDWSFEPRRAGELRTLILSGGFVWRISDRGQESSRASGSSYRASGSSMSWMGGFGRSTPSRTQRLSCSREVSPGRPMAVGQSGEGKRRNMWVRTTGRGTGWIFHPTARYTCRSSVEGSELVLGMADWPTDCEGGSVAGMDFSATSNSTRRVNMRVSPGGMAPTATTRRGSFSPFGSWTSTSTENSQAPSLPGCRMTPSTLSGQTELCADRGRVTASNRRRR